MTQTNGYLAPYIRSFFEDYLVCRRNVSTNTIQSYRDGLKLFLLYASEILRKPPATLLVTDVAESVVLGFLQHLESTRSNSIERSLIIRVSRSSRPVELLGLARAEISSGRARASCNSTI